MKHLKQIILSISLCFLASNSTLVLADVYSDYKMYAEQAIAQVEFHKFGDAYKTFNKLSELGFTVMAIFEKKKLECAASLKIFRSEYKAMESLSVEEIERLYHDGERFPSTTPPICYFGRTLVVHPAMNKVRVKNSQDWSAEIELTAISEIRETIGYLENIKELLK